VQGEHPLPDVVIEQFSKTKGELCDNVFLLSRTYNLLYTLRSTDLLSSGKSAVLTTAEGLRIACIGGTYKPAIYSGSEIPHVRAHSNINRIWPNRGRVSRPLILHRTPSRNYCPTLPLMRLELPLSHPECPLLTHPHRST
jgi:hypothetical protein